MKEALYILGEVVHCLQRERGCAAIFLYSGGSVFSDRMLVQFSVSDSAVRSFRDGLGDWCGSLGFRDLHYDTLHGLLDLCLFLPEWRERILSFEISASDCINHYSHRLIGAFLQSMVDIALSMGSVDSSYVSAYNAFLHWKESVGLERAVCARGFFGDCFHNKEFKERILFLLSEQDTYQNMFLALLRADRDRFIRDSLEAGEDDHLARIHEALKYAPDSEVLSDLTPFSWFDLMSAKIDSLHRLEVDLVGGLSSLGDGVALDVDIPPSSSGFGMYEDLIRSLRLFSGFSDKKLHSLLVHGRIRNFSKGKLLFLSGERANRLYIILRGWVKLFKSSVSGEETVLQMLSSGDMVMESAIFLNTSFPVSCQLVSDSVLLSFPAPIFRSYIRDDTDFALNLLSSMSHRSQGLIHRIENARLKSVDERVGWFLLKCLLGQGRVSRHIELPYDKSVIASYLDMRRETFSRVLQRMKSRGFKIENDTVVIPSLTSLCGFCDEHIAPHCALHGTSDCPNPQCSGCSDSVCGAVSGVSAV